MKKKCMVAMLTAAALAVSGLWGCGSVQDSGEDPVSESVAESGTEQENQAGESSAIDTSEKVELRIMVQTALDPLSLIHI